jgi:hypothetical protein
MGGLSAGQSLRCMVVICGNRPTSQKAPFPISRFHGAGRSSHDADPKFWRALGPCVW